MTRSSLGLKALGLCVLVGMFAITGAAQATTGAFWQVKGVAKTANGQLVETETDVTLTLLTELGGKQLHLKCPTIKFVGAKLVEPNGGFTGKIDFSGCDFLSLKTAGGELVLQKACEPFAEGVRGLIVTNSVTGLIVLHTPTGGKAEGVLEVKPTTAGGLFVNMSLGSECAFGETMKIGGVLFLKDRLNQFSTELVKHLFEVLNALTKLVINEGVKTATIDGSTWMFLGSPNSGVTWSGKPA